MFEDGTVGWSQAPLEPRWGPDRPLAERITRVGRFGSIDPTRPGRVWGPARWAGLVGWVLFVSAAYARARRRAPADRSAAGSSRWGILR